ncbi:hypothetical protein AB204_18170 [Xenorhabdus khoisanae]|uniref:Secreted protein n=1 Tax=Xenorhabdus khoisanae TaxID=880157 RepID=A0A0J5FN80_9GAMM|nr:hypothetical protein AB204_18170 [Xenorhabdus khoisanae]
MKKFILLCLLAGTTLLASMQTYAYVCAPLFLHPLQYAKCVARCSLKQPGIGGRILCAYKMEQETGSLLFRH